MNRVDYFATPVFTFDVQYDNESLVAWAKQKNDMQDPNQHGGMQSFNTADKLNNDTMQHNFPFAFVNLQKILQGHIDTVASELEFPKVNLQNYWLNVNPYGSCNDVHNHPNALLVANYYIKAPSTSIGDIVIHRDDESQYYTSSIPNKNKITQRRVNVTPHTGLFIVFPGWVKHSVNTNLDKNNDRISLSLNYGRTQK